MRAGGDGVEEAGTMPETFDAVTQFETEYRALCERHRLVVSYDGGYMASEVRPLRDDDFYDEWRLRLND